MDSDPDLRLALTPFRAPVGWQHRIPVLRFAALRERFRFLLLVRKEGKHLANFPDHHRPGLSHPFTTMTGSNLATFEASPACSVASTTAVTSLYAPGASSAMPRIEGLFTMMPRAAS